MRFHPVQHNSETLCALSEVFRNRMLKRRILTSNARQAKRIQKWLSEMGARMRPKYTGRRPVVSNWIPDTENFLNFQVECKESKRQFSMGAMEIEIPWELADKVLTLGYLP